MSGVPGDRQRRLGADEVSGRRRVPRPAVRTSAASGADRACSSRRRSLRLVEQHVGRRQPVRAAMLDEERPVRIEHEVGRRASERAA